MRTIKTKHLQPGAVLAEDARDRSGRLLLEAGASITTKHIQTFLAWGVAEVSVADETMVEQVAEPVAEPDPASRAQAESRLEPRFVLVDRSHPAINTLYEIAVERLAYKIMRGAE